MDIAKLVLKNRKQYLVFFDEFEKEIIDMNKNFADMTKKFYSTVIFKFKSNDNGNIENNPLNMSRLALLGQGLDTLTKSYRKQYGDVLRANRVESIKLIKNQNRMIEERVSEQVDEKIIEFKPEKKQIETYNEIYKNAFRKVDEAIIKWKNFAHDAFLFAIVGTQKPEELINKLFTDSGSIRIGSSLEQSSLYEGMRAITEERTAYHRDRAKKNGWTFCWNANPMDRRTKPECMSASLAGVISEDKMGSEHGFPPRQICRCEIVYTREEWEDINKGVNKAIEDRRKEFIDESKSWPNKKEWWYNSKGTRITPKDSATRRKQKYKYDEERIELAEKTKVPDYVYKPPVISPVEPPVIPSVNPRDVDLTDKQNQAIDFVNEKGKLQHDQLIKITESWDKSLTKQEIDKLSQKLNDELGSDNLPFYINNDMRIGKPGTQPIIESGKLKNQFELADKATSGGTINPIKGGQRDGWEKTIFGDKLQDQSSYIKLKNGDFLPENIARERPIYGYLNDSVRNDKINGNYGRVIFQLDSKVKNRMTFSIDNSSMVTSDIVNSGNGVATANNNNFLLRNILQNSSERDVRDILAGNRNFDSATSINSRYTETQIFGGIDFSKGDVRRIFIPDMKKFDHIEEFAAKYGIEVVRYDY